MATFIAGAGQNLNFAVPINYARGMLQQVDDTPVAVLDPMTASGSGAASRPIARENARSG